MRLAVLGAAIAAALAAAPVGSTHTLYVSGNYVEGPICVGGSTAFAEGPAANGGQAFVEVWIQSYGAGWCLTAKNMPAGHVVIRRELFRWTGYEWQLCATNGWLYNDGGPTSYKYAGVTWSPMPCGNAMYYGHLGYGYAWFNGQWLGGARWTGYHWM